MCAFRSDTHHKTDMVCLAIVVFMGVKLNPEDKEETHFPSPGIRTGGKCGWSISVLSLSFAPVRLSQYDVKYMHKHCIYPKRK